MRRLLRVLVIEDSEDDTQLLLRELRRGEYEVEFDRVESTEAMKSALTQKIWDLILSDYSLPSFSAPDALEVLKASGLDLPFIIVSGTIGEESAVTSLKAGANDFLVKGKYARLVPAIERELREAESRRNHKRAEEQIRYHARLLKHVNDAVIATDEHFYITAWNRAAERIYGWRSTEVIGRGVDEVLKSGLSAEQQAAAKALLKEMSSFRSERIHSRKNGQPVYVEENTIAVTDEHGKITGYVSVNRDITERKHAEAALRENERLLSEAQSIGHVGSWSYNLIMNSLQYSDEMYRLLDVSRREFPHTMEAFLNLVYPLDHAVVTQWLEDMRSGRQTTDLNFRLFRKNGDLSYIQCRGALTFDAAGRPVRFVGMAQDITERKLAEIQIRQQLEHLSALSRIDQAIASNLDLHFTLKTFISEVRTQLQVDAADILLLNPEEQVLVYATGQGFLTQVVETARVPIGQGLAGRAAQELHLIEIENLKIQLDDSFLCTLLIEENFACYYGMPLIIKGKVEGVLELFHRSPLQTNPQWMDFFYTLAGQAAIAIDNATMFENLQDSNLELINAYDTTIEGWSRALDLRDKETEGHTQRVTEMTANLALKFGFTEEEMLHIRRGALLHDIGKMGVPDNILLKPHPLAEEEWVIMRKHTQYAYDLLKPITFLGPALDIPYCHHEKWDGTGYPRGLKGEDIPLAARIFAVVDVYDALTSDRPYRPAWPKDKALDHIRSLSGIHFDPQIVDAFFTMISNSTQRR